MAGRRGRASFIEEMTERVRTKGDYTRGDKITGATIERIDVPVSDEEGEAFAEEGEQHDMPPIEVIATDMRRMLYVPVNGHPGVFKPTPVHKSMVARCLTKRTIPAGKRAFYRKADLPSGYILWDDYWHTMEHECPEENCTKVLDSAHKLKGHIIGVHGMDEWEMWKEEVEDAVRAEREKVRDARKKAKQNGLKPKPEVVPAVEVEEE